MRQRLTKMHYGHHDMLSFLMVTYACGFLSSVACGLDSQLYLFLGGFVESRAQMIKAL